MIRIFLPLIGAALGLAAASCSQSEGPFDQPSDAASASQPAAEASGAPAERRASTLIGMPVVSADGSPLGEVKDIVFDPQGQATHVVIAYGAQSETGPEEIPEGKPASGRESKLTAVPWDTLIAGITDAHVVLDAAKLQGAPSFTPQEWPDLDDPAWSATADAYWRKVARPAVATRPGTAVDSSSRLRRRPTRDGE
jgi:sporulation protein YlmC with PRC-barrel domain